MPERLSTKLNDPAPLHKGRVLVSGKMGRPFVEGMNLGEGDLLHDMVIDAEVVHIDLQMATVPSRLRWVKGVETIENLEEARTTANLEIAFLDGDQGMIDRVLRNERSIV